MRISDWSSDVCSSDLLRGSLKDERRAGPSPTDRGRLLHVKSSRLKPLLQQPPGRHLRAAWNVAAESIAYARAPCQFPPPVFVDGGSGARARSAIRCRAASARQVAVLIDDAPRAATGDGGLRTRSPKCRP